MWNNNWIIEAGCTWEEGEQHKNWKSWENKCRKFQFDLNMIKIQFRKDKNKFSENFEKMKIMICRINQILKPHNYELCLMNWERWMGTDDRLGKSW